MAALRHFAMIFTLFLLGLTACAPDRVIETKSAEDEFTHTIYLVRHAEKQKGDDPGLTDEGHLRAQTLKDKLSDTGITRIYSSDYKRTQQTAGPLADHLGLSVISYDPRDLDGFANQLSSQTGVSLVVGHSNTTPQLAEALGGGIVVPMPETEYDRFIEIKLGKDGKVLKSTSRFGAAANPKNEVIVHPAWQRTHDVGHYAPAVRAGDFLFLSGIVARLDPDIPASDRERKAYQSAFRMIENTMKDADAGWEHVVEIETFHTDMAAQIDLFSEVKDEYVKAPYPTWTAIGIDRLYQDDAIAEIKVTAYLSAPRTLRKNPED